MISRSWLWSFKDFWRIIDIEDFWFIDFEGVFSPRISLSFCWCLWLWLSIFAALLQKLMSNDIDREKAERRRKLIGNVLLIIVNVLWVLSAEATEVSRVVNVSTCVPEKMRQKYSFQSWEQRFLFQKCWTKIFAVITFEKKHEVVVFSKVNFIRNMKIKWICVQYIFLDEKFKRPFFTVYVKSVLCTVYLLRSCFCSTPNQVRSYSFEWRRKGEFSDNQPIFAVGNKQCDGGWAWNQSADGWDCRSVGWF